MAALITVEDVKAYGITGADAMLADYIAVVDQADDCLDANGVAETTQRILKINAVGHMATLAAGGQIRSQSAPNGASRSFAVPQGQGIDSTNWGASLRSLDVHGCLVRLLEADKAKPFIMCAGPGRRRGC